MRRRGTPRPENSRPVWINALAEALALLDERHADPADRDGAPCEECGDHTCPFATGDECDAATTLEPLRPMIEGP